MKYVLILCVLFFQPAWSVPFNGQKALDDRLLDLMLHGSEKILEIQDAIVRGANPDARDDRGNTALHYADGSSVLMAVLLEAGADIHAQNDAGKTSADNLAQCVPPNPFVITAYMALGADFDEAIQIRINEQREKQIASIHKGIDFFESMNTVTKGTLRDIKAAVRDISIELPVIEIGWFGWTIAELGGGVMDIELEVDEMPAFRDIENGIKNTKVEIGEMKDLEKAIQKAKDIEREMQEAENEGGSKLLVYETMQGESPMETLYAADEYFCKKYKIKELLINKDEEQLQVTETIITKNIKLGSW